MSPALTLTLMVLGWFAVAIAMLWGMLRIARRHHPSSDHSVDDQPTRPAQISNTVDKRRRPHFGRHATQH
nr:hypothetical protein [Pseudomonas matsuisoli]